MGSVGGFIGDVFDTIKDIVYDVPIVGDIAKGTGNVLEETYEFATGLDTKREAEKQAKEIQKQYEEQMAEIEANRRAAIAKRRREAIASNILQAVSEADRATNTAVSSPKFGNAIPSIGNSIDMSQG